ncbi:MAG: gliding motility-associated C-terminal domain-containing protein [Pedobacter sp.]
MYNAFSPDGDGKNDTWEVKNIDAFPDNDLKIFDRSGNLVYRMNSYN